MSNLLNDFDWKDYGVKHGLDSDSKCLEHAIHASIVEKQNPAVFDWKRYIKDYPDLQKMFKNGKVVTYSDAICHYLNHGINETRRKYILGTDEPYVYDFDWKMYDKLNPDIFIHPNRGEIMGRLLCFRHWCEFGYKEGRKTSIGNFDVKNDASISEDEDINQQWINALNNILKTTTFQSIKELLLSLMFMMDKNVGDAKQTAVFELSLKICFGFQRLSVPHAKHSGINIICNTIIDKCIDADIFSHSVNIHGDDHNSDIFFSTYNAFDNTKSSSGCRILFIQDLIYLYNVNARDVEPTGTKQKDNIDNILKSINPTDYLLFTTNYQINKMIEHLHLYPNINSNNIYLYNLPNRFDHLKSQINIELPNKKYDIVCLCQHSRRKNLDLYNIILQKLPHLKIAVVSSIQLFGSKDIFFENIKTCPNITLYSNLEDEQLIEIYKQSKFCLTLSLDEGFGLHALECTTFGCVNIVTSGISFNEIFEDNAIYINNIHDSNDVLRQVIDNVNDTNYIKYSEKLPNIIDKFSLIKSKDAFSKVVTKIYNDFEEKRRNCRRKTIVINCQPIQLDSRGIGHYSVSFLNALLKIYKNEYSFKLIVNNLDKSRLTKIEVVGYVEYIEIDAGISEEHEKKMVDRINSLEPDIFVNLSVFSDISRNVTVNLDLLNKHIQTFAILYDLIPLKDRVNFFDTWSLNSKTSYMKQFENMKKYQTKLSISNFITNDCSDLLDNIVTIGTGVNDYTQIHTQDVQAKVLDNFNINKKYIYIQTGFGENKGLDFFYKQYLKLPQYIHEHTLLVLGTHYLPPRLDNFRNHPNVRFTGYLSEMDLHILHENAWLFICPSTFEGFGIPPVEAMKHNRPVIVANCTSLTEVMNNDIFTFKHHDDSCSNLIIKLYNDIDFYNECLLHCRSRKNAFDWNDVCNNFIKLIDPTNNIKTVSVLICLRDASEYIEYMKTVYAEIEGIYKDKFRFEYFLYENNSKDGTQQKLIEFKNAVRGRCTIFSEDIPNLKKYSGISLERGAHVRNMRNRFKNMVGKHDSDYVFYSDADVYFKPELIENLSKYINDDVKMVVSNGITRNVDASFQHHYDTLAFITLNNITHEETANSCLNVHCKSCIQHRKTENKEICEENYFDSEKDEILEIKSGFGCCSLIETAMFNKVTFSNESETVLTLEWPSFCRNIRDNGGRIILSIKNKTLCG